MKTLTFLVDEDTYLKLFKISAKNRRSKAAQILIYIDEGIEREENKNGKQ